MNAWEWLNVLARAAITIVVVLKLWYFYDHYHRDERFGLGVAGSCSFLSVFAFQDGQFNPFAYWTPALFAFGTLVYFIGRLRRQFHHRQANLRQIELARERFGDRM